MKIADIQPRMLMGPGPSDVNPRVLRAMATPPIGHMDGQFFQVLDDLRAMLQAVFQTRNELTFVVSGTGMAGMETCAANLIEPGDRALVCVGGVFGGRMKEVAERCGAQVATIDVPWGQVASAAQVEQALGERGPFKVVALVHGETSTGAMQPAPDISRAAHAHGALLLVDAVASLGGAPVDVDGWGIDACYTGSQKCLSAPPGLAPVTFSPAAAEAIARRKAKTHSWYLDASLIRKYWEAERVYHHTAPINLYYALHEALRIVLEEGLAARWARHQAAHQALKAGLAELGLSLIADPAHQLPTLNAVQAPEGIDEARVRRRLLDDYSIEIGAGLGAFKGKAWRIGLMGEGAEMGHVKAVLDALRAILRSMSTST